ncbi:MAG: hypothetical protein M3Z04_06110 [Chloroflexota bacterium]|nr:hypothetical protein [Chloroflexota bacterium]
MPDPRWPPMRGGPDLLAPGLAPAWGAFQRSSEGGGVTVQPVRRPSEDLRVLGTSPVAASSRRRNAANSRVYVTDLATCVRRDTVRIPVIGEIAAGQYDATVAFHDYDAYEYGVEVDRALVTAGSGAYALRVRGTSMTHVGIQPGDLVVVQPANSADQGDFVVARLTDSDSPEGYVTLKRFYRKRDHIFLQSATADREPIRLYPFGRAGGGDRDRVKVQGRVIVVIKPTGI